METGHRYYGVRFAKDCKPDELLVSYFSSSVYVKSAIDVLGLPKASIRRTFDSADQARKWEQTVLRRIRAVSSDLWLNKTDNISICPEAALAAAKRPKSETMRKRLSATRKSMGYKPSKEQLAKMNAGTIGCKRPSKSRSMVGNTLRAGCTDSAETRERKRAARVGKIWITNGLTCTTINQAEPLPEGFWRGKLQKTRKGDTNNEFLD